MTSQLKNEIKSFQQIEWVLSCYSKAFEKTFHLEMKKYENSVILHNISTKSLQTIIDFIYTGKSIDNGNVMNLIVMSCKLFFCG